MPTDISGDLCDVLQAQIPEIKKTPHVIVTDSHINLHDVLQAQTPKINMHSMSWLLTTVIISEVCCCLLYTSPSPRDDY